MIDQFSRICPYCNWDQTAPVPARAPAPVAAAAPPPDDDKVRAKKYMLLGAGFLALIVVSFLLGSLIHGKDAPADAPVPVTEQPKGANTKAFPRTDVALVPVNEPGGIAESPITSAPAPNIAQGVPNEYQRSDATAVSAAEYQQLAAREQAQRKLALTDPRSLGGAAYAQGPRRRPLAPAMPQPQMSSAPSSPISIRTRPVPRYQPIPDVHVDNGVTARLDLVVGADGNVKEVNVRNAIPGQTAKLIAAVQSWRFKPATENGVPVAAPFSVDISFRGHD